VGVFFLLLFFSWGGAAAFLVCSPANELKKH